MSALRASIAGVGVAAPGMDGWDTASRVLRGEAPHEPVPTVVSAPQRLPPNERRRTTNTIRLAFQAAEEALAAWGGEAGDLSSVFASSNGDLDINLRICTMLAAGQSALSPTQFHNSVHNAPAGYWSIATGARGPSCSLSAEAGSAAAGLLEAMMLVNAEQRSVMLVVYDILPPPPLDTVVPIRDAIAVGLVLTPPGNGGPTLSVEPTWEDNVETDGQRFAGHPATALMPLLQALAAGQGRCTVAGPDFGAAARIEP